MDNRRIQEIRESAIIAAEIGEEGRVKEMLREHVPEALNALEQAIVMLEEADLLIEKGLSLMSDDQAQQWHGVQEWRQTRVERLRDAAQSAYDAAPWAASILGAAPHHPLLEGPAGAILEQQIIKAMHTVGDLLKTVMDAESRGELGETTLLRILPPDQRQPGAGGDVMWTEVERQRTWQSLDRIRRQQTPISAETTAQVLEEGLEMAYFARSDDGKMQVYTRDIPNRREEIANLVAGWIRNGMIVERLPLAVAEALCTDEGGK